MGKYGDPVFQRAQSGSRVVSQYQRGRSGPPAATSSSGGSIAYAARFKAVPINSSQWTAVTTGYPDAPHPGTPTYYRADVAHNLGNQHAIIAELQDATGRAVSARIVEKTNEDPANPGNLHPNSVRIWISMDAAPAADMYVVVLG